MRLLVGMILGVGIALALTFFHDRSVPADGQHQIVNWQVLGAVTHDQVAALQRLWTDSIAMVHKA
jgi:hypothetical protein